MISSDSQDKRLKRLVEELSEEGVELGNILPAGLLKDDTGLSLVQEELLNALHVPKHEGRRPPYGCLITTRVLSEVDLVHTIALEPKGRLDEARAIADGRDLVLCRSTRGKIWLVNEQVMDELSAIRLARSFEGAMVQRLESGIVKVIGSRGVLSSEGRDWVQRPSATAALAGFPSRLVMPKGGPSLEQILALLELCFHRLSPLGIGATFILDLAGDGDELLQTLSDAGKRPVMGLNVFDTSSHVALRNLLAMVDGACIAASNGDVQRYEVKLPASERAQGFVSQHGGTRHTSAKRYTFDHAEVIAVVVSADGPVTVFSDGVELLKIDPGSRSLSWLLREPVGELREMEETTHDEECANCGKTLRVRVVKKHRCTGQTELTCPICQFPITLPGDSVESDARPVKFWEQRLADARLAPSAAYEH